MLVRIDSIEGGSDDYPQSSFRSNNTIFFKFKYLKMQPMANQFFFFFFFKCELLYVCGEAKPSPSQFF